MSHSAGFGINKVEASGCTTNVLVVEAIFVIGEHRSSYTPVHVTGQASTQRSGHIFTVEILWPDINVIMYFSELKMRPLSYYLLYLILVYFLFLQEEVGLLSHVHVHVHICSHKKHQLNVLKYFY
jgi:hypothetical protein